MWPPATSRQVQRPRIAAAHSAHDRPLHACACFLPQDACLAEGYASQLCGRAGDQLRVYVRFSDDVDAHRRDARYDAAANPVRRQWFEQDRESLAPRGTTGCFAIETDAVLNSWRLSEGLMIGSRSARML